MVVVVVIMSYGSWFIVWHSMQIIETLVVDVLSSVRLRSLVSTLLLELVSCISRSVWRTSRRTTRASHWRSLTRSSRTVKLWARSRTECAFRSLRTNIIGCTWKPSPCQTVLRRTLIRLVLLLNVWYIVCSPVTRSPFCPLRRKLSTPFVMHHVIT